MSLISTSLIIVILGATLFPIHYTRKSRRRLFLKRRSPAFMLVDYLGKTTGSGKVPLYSFYTDLVTSFLSFHQQYGLSLKAPFEALKKSLLRDLRWQKKIRSALLNGMVQFLGVTVITLIFMESGKQIVGLNLGSLKYQVLALQGLGLIIFLGGYIGLRAFCFKNFSLLYRCLLSFRCLSELRLSQDQILEEISLPPTLQIHQYWAENIIEQLKSGVSSWRQEGKAITGLLKELLEEAEFQWEQRFQFFLHLVNGLKFFCLSTFFLGGYLYFLVQLGQLFLIE